MASDQSLTRFTADADVVMNEFCDEIGWGGADVGRNISPNPFVQGSAGMGVVIPNRMYNMPVAQPTAAGAVPSSEGVSFVKAPVPFMSEEEMTQQVDEAERLRKCLHTWHVKHTKSLDDLRNQMQDSDASHAAAIAAANARVLALQTDNLALRNQVEDFEASHATAITAANARVFALQTDNFNLRDAAATFGDAAATFDEQLEACQTSLRLHMGKHRQYKTEYRKLRNKYVTPDVNNNDVPAGMPGPSTA